jgi:SulP family sulfate permease
MRPPPLLQRFFPFLIWWPLVNRSSLKADIMAGLTGAMIVLPQGVVFAQIAGLPPEYGLYTAMVTPIVAALFGSSRHLISGPTTAISIVVLSTLSGYAEPFSMEFVRLAFSLALLSGIFQLVLGLVRMGSLVNFVSHTVVVGFTAGAAILIATKQLRHVLGFSIPGGLSFPETWGALFSNLGDTNPYVLLVGIVTLAAALVFKRFLPRWSYMLLAMVIGSTLAYVIGGEEKGIKLIESISVSLPPPLSMPLLSWDWLYKLASDAFAVALLGLIEAVAIARAIGVQTQQRIDGNQEFIGQGLSNMVGSFFSCYPGSGSFTRSGVNQQVGAKTPLSAIFAAIFLALILLLIAPLMAYLPLAVMGGIILLVAYNLIDFAQIKEIFLLSRSETVILLVTLLATLLIELEFAIYLGVILSLVIYLQRTSKPKITRLAPNPKAHHPGFEDAISNQLPECPQLQVVRVDGSIFFGSVDHLSAELRKLRSEGPPRLLILGSAMTFIDLAGAELLALEAERWRSLGGGIYFSNLKGSVEAYLKKGFFLERIGKENIFHSKREAITSIYQQLDPEICALCTARIFKECPKKAKQRGN